jgi:glycosyltransferase involved in cell wall biosynthesis
MSDILVLPSQRETWGLVINEALCFSLPVVVSDQVGAGFDLVIPGENGYVFPVGDVSELTDQLSRLLNLSEEDRLKMGKRSKQLIEEWSDRNLATSLLKYLDTIHHVDG